MLLPLPITDAQARLGQTIVEEGSQLARYVSWVLGTIPQDVVGLLIGDPLHAVRLVVAEKLDRIVRKKLQDRGINEPQAVSPSIAIPLLKAAYDESRPELQELWAALIAAAMDPKRSDRVRLSFIDAVKQFDPLDALVLRERCKHLGSIGPNALDFVSTSLGKRQDEVYVSVQNLARLQCCVIPNDEVRIFNSTVFGRELVRACSD